MNNKQTHFNKFLRILFTIFLLFLLGSAIFNIFNTPFEKPAEEITLSEVVKEINEEKVAKISVVENTLKIELIDQTKQKAQKESEASLTESLKNYGVDAEKLKNVQIEVKKPSSVSYWLSFLLPILLPFLLIAGFIYFMFRSAQNVNTRAISFGQTRAQPLKKEGKRITFKDVAGVKEAKEELQEVVDFLKNPKKYTSLGARIPRGVLIVGPPGTGKTLLARAVAGEANVPFFHISGSEFVEMFVGVGAARVRDLFAKAKRNAPSIIFIDELDAVGRHRGAGLGGGHDEREQTLNQILVEMDGFERDTNVIVMSATNRPDVLDPALLRPGRFDRRIVLDIPDIKEREKILEIHSKEVPFAKNVSLKKIASRTPGFSGADLANLVNEAAILTAKNNKKVVGMPELLSSIEKVMLGPERKSHILSQKEKEIAAYHEAGHAVVAHILPHTDPIQKVSIVSRGRAAGYTLKMPEEDKRLHTKSEFLSELAVLLGGYVAEKKVFNELTTGASSDLKQATHLARKLVTEFGMSDLGPVTFGEKEELIFLGKELHETRNYSEEIAAKIDKEITKIIKKAQKQAEEVISKNFSKLEKVTKKLLEQETIEREEFIQLMA